MKLTYFLAFGFTHSRVHMKNQRKAEASPRFSLLTYRLSPPLENLAKLQLEPASWWSKES
jgi:hypothetical protein